MINLIYYKFNADLYTLRIEYFGGLLINKQTMSKYQITQFDTVYLLCLQTGLSKKQIVNSINCKYQVAFRPDDEEFLKLNVIQQYDKCEKEKDIDKFFNEITNKVEIATHKRYLCSPLELTIYPTVRCQLQCPFCFLQEKRNSSSKEYDYNHWIDLIKSFIKEGTVSVSILGGEPSLYFDIIPLIKEIDKLGIRFTMTSNGQKWSEDLFNCVINSNHLTPILSVESFNKVPNTPQNSKLIDPNKTKRLIQELYKAGKKSRINTVYTGQSDKEIFDIIDFCSKYNVEKYSISLYFGTDSSMPSILDFKRFKERINTYVTQKNISNPHVTFEGCMIYAAYPNIDGSIVKTEYQKKQYGCECGNTILEILADGSMYSCASYISSGQIIGNAFHQNWKEIWDNSELLNQLRYKKCTDSICVKCSLYHFCNGGCPAYKQLKKQDIYSSCDDRCLIHKTKLQQ